MGEWFTVGLQTGKKVTEAVDEFIRKEHFGGQRKDLVDGTTMYQWSMKWSPHWYKDEERFVAVLNRFEDGAIADVPEEELEDYAFKLVAVGDDGGSDEMGNDIGYELFDGLYEGRCVTFPEEWEELPNVRELDTVRTALADVSCEESAEKLAATLLDDSLSTYKVFEELAGIYLDASVQKREGMDRVFSYLTGYSIPEFAQELLSSAENGGEA